MPVAPQELAKRVLRQEWDHLSQKERAVVEHILGRLHGRHDPLATLHEERTLGERAADAIARFGGSWGFIGLFAVVLGAWTMLNLWLGPREAFDPYPFIFLNLILSMLAAVQAPIIMMSQNRQAERDRVQASNDYEVNVRAELAIRMVHEKVDRLEQMIVEDLVATQREQLQIIRELAERRPGPAA